MSATETSSIDTPSITDTDEPVKILGVIAGGGEIPQRLVQACDEKSIPLFIVGFDGQTDPSLYGDHNHLITRLGAAGQIISTLKSHNIYDLVVIGSIRRPSLAELKPDWKTTQFFAKLGLKAMGDNDLLSAVRAELEKEGFRIHGVQEFVNELLVSEGILGRCTPSRVDEADIQRGLEVSQQLGRLDIGQSVIVQQGLILGVEAIEGTDALIHRCKDHIRKGKAPILVKSCKPQQDTSLDLPTLGPATIEACAHVGIGGIALQAEKTLVVDPQRVAEIADHYKIFISAVSLSSNDDQKSYV